MRCVAIVLLSAIVFVLSQTDTASAQCVDASEPIVLTVSEACCQSPAATASEPVSLPAGDRAFALANYTQRVPVVPAASRLVPLPAKQTWRGYEPEAIAMSECPVQLTPMPVMPLAAASQPGVVPLSNVDRVEVWRPAEPPPAVPQGYVVGQGLIGQPKLFKPGQPVRNFLRYLSP